MEAFIVILLCMIFVACAFCFVEMKGRNAIAASEQEYKANRQRLSESDNPRLKQALQLKKESPDISVNDYHAMLYCAVEDISASNNRIVNLLEQLTNQPNKDR